MGENSEKKVLIVGHSWAFGTFSNYNEWKEYFNGLMGQSVKLEVCAKPNTSIGWSTEQVKERKGADFVLLFTGVNDVDFTNPDVSKVSEQVLGAFEKMIAAAKKNNPDAQIIVLSIPHFNRAERHIAEINKNFPKLQRKMGFSLVDLTGPPFAIPLDKTTEGGRYLHPEDGYAKLRELLKENLPDYVTLKTAGNERKRKEKAL
ncbi:MAG: SGNH/GDSL hydrolase family protein [Candidatus Micrarchaeia archaeon]|jgi:hypothetical protein